MKSPLAFNNPQCGVSLETRSGNIIVVYRNNSISCCVSTKIAKMPKAIAVKRWAAVSAECATVTKVNNDNAIVDNDNDNEEDEGDYDSRVLVVDPVNIGDNDDDDSDDDNGALFMEVDSKDLGDDDDSELVIDDDYDGRDEQERGNNSGEYRMLKLFLLIKLIFLSVVICIFLAHFSDFIVEG